MKKNKKDKLNIIILTIFFITIILITIGNDYLYGSTLDWASQHSEIPDYFRTLFYSDFSLFPDFAPNIGSGQNIYNLSYYGLFNPVIMFSYFLPFISMKTYIQISSMFLVYMSIILFYYYLRSHKFNEKSSFLGTIAFFTASPLLFHSHRHIMFMNYMPFLIMALIGVDKYFKENNKSLLCLSTILIILMSYYYSIPAILVIVIYGVYSYIQKHKKITFKSFIQDGLKFIFPIICAILTCGVLLIPTFYVILTSRLESEVIINLKELLIPAINIKYLTYNSYGIGLTAFALIALIVLGLSKKKEDIYLTIALTAPIIFPIINYILNATMYINSKTLIPFLPLYALVVTQLFDKVFKREINIKKVVAITLIITGILLLTNKAYNYFYLDLATSLIIIILTIKLKKENILKIFTTICLVLYSIGTNKSDTLVQKSDYYHKDNINQKELASKIEDKYSHTSLYNYKLENINYTYENLNINQNTIYSSTNNKYYNIFFFDTFANVMQSRNRLILSSNENLLFLMFTNNKYLIGNDIDVKGYREIEKIGNTSLYQNDNVLPYMYVSYKNYNEGEFNKQKFPYTNEILLNNTIVESSENKTFDTTIKEIPKDEFEIKYIDENLTVEGNRIIARKDGKMIIDVPYELQDNILFIDFDLKPQSCKKGDLTIDINNHRNKLTCREWKYYNGNTDFSYVISDNYLDNLTITFTKGTYDISNLKIYYMNYHDIEDIKQNVTEVQIDKKNSKTDKIIAEVEAKENGYFVTTFPYDNGFKVKVDGKEIEHEKVNTAYLGFKIEKGKHKIEINYTSPFKNLGIITSILGVIIYVIFIRKK